MDNSLRIAAEQGVIDNLYELINQNPRYLQSFDDIPFVETPLHVAAAAGHTHFAIELMRLHPSFRTKLNPRGRSPLHLALEQRHLETAKRLVQVDGELLRVHGREGITPLHLVVQLEMERDEDEERVLVLGEFLLACPLAIEDVTIHGETVLHLAVQNGSIRTLKVLVGWLRWTKKRELLHWKDENGNTPLHLAASANQPQVLRMVISNDNKISMNSEGLTALDIVCRHQGNAEEAKRVLLKQRAQKATSITNRNPRTELTNLITHYPDSWESMTIERMRIMTGLRIEAKSALLVVAALIMTITYQGMLSPPGGLISQTESVSQNTTITDFTSQKAQGTSVMKYATFFVFAILNTSAFLSSTYMAYWITLSLIHNVYSFPVHFLLGSYMAAMCVIFPRSKSDTMYTIFTLGVSVFSVIILPTYSTYVHPKTYISGPREIIMKFMAAERDYQKVIY